MSSCLAFQAYRPLQREWREGKDFVYPNAVPVKETTMTAGEVCQPPSPRESRVKLCPCVFGEGRGIAPVEEPCIFAMQDPVNVLDISNLTPTQILRIYKKLIPKVKGPQQRQQPDSLMHRTVHAISDDAFSGVAGTLIIGGFLALSTIGDFAFSSANHFSIGNFAGNVNSTVVLQNLPKLTSIGNGIFIVYVFAGRTH